MLDQAGWELNVNQDDWVKLLDITTAMRRLQTIIQNFHAELVPTDVEFDAAQKA